MKRKKVVIKENTYKSFLVKWLSRTGFGLEFMPACVLMGYIIFDEGGIIENNLFLAIISGITVYVWALLFIPLYQYCMNKKVLEHEMK